MEEEYEEMIEIDTENDEYFDDEDDYIEDLLLSKIIYFT